MFWKKKCFEIGFEGVQRGFLSERKGMVIPRRRAEDRKGTRTNSGKSETRNTEAESIRGRAEGTVEDSHRDKTEQCSKSYSLG